MKIHCKIEGKLEFFEVKEIIYMKEIKDFKILFKDVFHRIKENENVLEHYDIYRYAIVKTVDDKIRECINYLDSKKLIWIDLETDRNYFIVNYNKYLETMRLLRKPSSDFFEFIKERNEGFCDVSRLMTEVNECKKTIDMDKEKIIYDLF